MATRKKTTAKKSSSGSDPKSKRIVKGKMSQVMHEFKHHELPSGGGRGRKKVSNPKQAIAIGLSEARKSGADIPPSPRAKKKAAATKKKTTAKKTVTKKTSSKGVAKKTAGRKTTAKKTATKKR